MVEIYARIGSSQIWKYQTFESLDETIEFERLDFSIPEAAIYEVIAFEAIQTLPGIDPHSGALPLQ